MRQAYSQQLRLDCQAVPNVKLNLNCRHELIPVLRALQHVYQHAELRDQVLALVAQDVNRDSVDDRGRKGLDYWTILVLAAVRLGCGLDYDQLQDLAENHRVLRQIMGIGDWDEATSFHWSRLRSNVSLVSTETLDQINQLVVAAVLSPTPWKSAVSPCFVSPCLVNRSLGNCSLSSSSSTKANPHSPAKFSQDSTPES